MHGHMNVRFCNEVYNWLLLSDQLQNEGVLFLSVLLYLSRFFCLCPIFKLFCLCVCLVVLKR